MMDMPSPEDDLDISAPEDSLPPLGLDDLPEAMRQACARAGWTRLMPVQAHALPYLLAGRDMMIQSRTGSGKTGAYLLPLLGRLDPALKKPQALILAPTRELASQVEHEASVLFADTDIRVAAVYGGVGYGRQLEALRQGVQVLVGTPGRVLDHLLRRTLVLDDLRALVFDEADRMLSIGFYPDMKEIQRYLPRRPLLASLFSATYPPHVLNLAGEFLRDPQMLSLSQGQVHVAATQHLFCECRPMDKDRALVRLLETENPASAIIFCNTKANVHYVTGVLQGFGYSADELSADLSQNRREEVLNKLRAGRVRLLVATDVAARGIDIPALSHVILYEPPEDRESYIHRAGRTGRAGAAGTVISLVDIMEKLELIRIARYYKIELLPLPTPGNEDVAKVVGQRVTALLEARRRACTGLQLERARRFLNLAAELGSGQDEEQGLLLALLLDAEYQQSLGVPPMPMPVARRAAPARDGQDGGHRGEGRRRRRRSRRGGTDSAPDGASDSISGGAEMPAESPESSAEPRAAQASEAGAPEPDEGPRGGEAGQEAPKKRRRRRSSRHGKQAAEQGMTQESAEGEIPAKETSAFAAGKDIKPEDIPVHEDRVRPGDADWR